MDVAYTIIKNTFTCIKQRLVFEKYISLHLLLHISINIPKKGLENSIYVACE